MKMELHYSIEAANKVLEAIRKIKIKSKEAIVIEAWSNGREQGYFLSYRDHSSDVVVWRGVCVAQQRNGDSIVVIFGGYDFFDISTHQPNDALWEDNRRWFRYDDAKGAALAIVDYLVMGIPIMRSVTR